MHKGYGILLRSVSLRSRQRLNPLRQRAQPDQTNRLLSNHHRPGSGAEKISLQGQGGPIAQNNFVETPFRGTLDLKGVGIADLQKFLQTPALANTDGSLSGQTNI